MLLLYKSYNYINKQKLFLKLSRGSRVVGRGSWVKGRGGRGGFRDTLRIGMTRRSLNRCTCVQTSCTTQVARLDNINVSNLVMLIYLKRLLGYLKTSSIPSNHGPRPTTLDPRPSTTLDLIFKKFLFIYIIIPFA